MVQKREEDIQEGAGVEAAPRQEISWKQLMAWIDGRIQNLEGADAKARLNESYRFGQLDVFKDLQTSLKNFDNVKDELTAK